MCVSVCKCDECSFFNYCINMDFESVNKDLLITPVRYQCKVVIKSFEKLL